jgi:resuscitation-promoting factor RpfB
LTYIEKHRRPGAKNARRVKRTVVTGLVAAVLASAPGVAASAAPLATGSPLSESTSPLGASSGATKAEIASLRAQIAAEAGQIHDYVDSYSRASSEAAVLSQELAAQRTQLVRVRHNLGKAESALRQAAIQSYTGSEGGDETTDVSGSAEAAIGTEFLSVASSDISNLEGNYRLDQTQVGGAIVRLTSEQQANNRALTQAATSRAEALRTATSDQDQLASLEDRLATLAPGTAQGGPTDNGLVKSTDASTSSTNNGSGGSSGSGSTPPTTSTTAPSTPPATGTPTTTDPPTTTTTVPPSSGGGGGGGASGVWLELRECESGDDYQANTGNGFYGAYQFTEQTWSGLGYPGYPYQEPPGMQDAAAQKLQAEAGWGQWPTCAAKLGLT